MNNTKQRRMSEYRKSKESFFPSCLFQMIDFRVLRAETPAPSFLSLLVNLLSLDPVSPLLAFPACHMLHQGCLDCGQADPARLVTPFHKHATLSIPFQPERSPAGDLFSKDPERACPQSLP